jgi:hypothetical protein
VHRIVRRSLTIAAAAAFITVAAAVPAQAAPTSFDVGDGAGRAWWNADPYVPDPQNPLVKIPGDAIRACDYKADGWGVKVYLDYNMDGDAERTVSTQGHNSPYCTGWATGDITPEGRKMHLWGCLVKGTEVKQPCGDDDNKEVVYA